MYISIYIIYYIYYIYIYNLLIYYIITCIIGIIQIKLKPPKNICKYELILLANESINEKKCMNYNFNNSYKNEIHSRNIICFVSNNNQYQVLVHN